MADHFDAPCRDSPGQELLADSARRSRRRGTRRLSDLPRLRYFGAAGRNWKIDFPACSGLQASSLPSKEAGKMPACRVRLEA